VNCSGISPTLENCNGTDPNNPKKNRNSHEEKNFPEKESWEEEGTGR
jgi:hypothetical protein